MILRTRYQRIPLNKPLKKLIKETTIKTATTNAGSAASRIFAINQVNRKNGISSEVTTTDSGSLLARKGDDAGIARIVVCAGSNRFGGGGGVSI